MLYRFKPGELAALGPRWLNAPSLRRTRLLSGPRVELAEPIQIPRGFHKLQQHDVYRADQYSRRSVQRRLWRRDVHPAGGDEPAARFHRRAADVAPGLPEFRRP